MSRTAITPETPLVLTEIRNGDQMSFADAAKSMPSGRIEGTISPSTVWRWAKRGARLSDGRRVKLEHAKIGSTGFTSKQALERFIVAITTGNVADVQTTPRSRRQSRGRNAAKLLANKGY